MRMVELGRTGLRVSRLGLGLASIGGMFAAVPRVAGGRDDRPGLGARRPAVRHRAGLRLRALGAAGRAGAARAAAGRVRALQQGRPADRAGRAGHPADLGRAAGRPRSPARLLVRRGDPLVRGRASSGWASTGSTSCTSTTRTSTTDRVDRGLRALAELRGRGTIRAISLGVNHADVAARFLRETGPAGPGLHPAGRPATRCSTSPAPTSSCRSARSSASPCSPPACSRAAYWPTPRTAPRTGTRGSHQTLLRRIDGLRELCRRYDVPLLAAAIQFPLDASRRTGGGGRGAEPAGDHRGRGVARPRDPAGVLGGTKVSRMRYMLLHKTNDNLEAGTRRTRRCWRGRTPSSRRCGRPAYCCSPRG